MTFDSSSSAPSPARSPDIGASEFRHQVRTPLNHIIGYSEMLIEEYHEAPRKAALTELLADANAMLEIVQQLLGGDQVRFPARVVSELAGALQPGIAHVRRAVHDLVAIMPTAAHSDLSRIDAATVALEAALGADRIETGEAPLPPAARTRQEPMSGPGRILVVDDNALNRDMLSRQLERQQHEVSTAADGSAALEMLRSRRFDIMLLDLMMPGMNGFEVLEAVKKDPVLSGTAVILVSALDEMDSVVRSIEAGAEDYLFKPVNPTLLRARVKSTLDKLRAEETIRRKQRLESIGLLAAGIAHDFNNLLTGIIGHAQLLEQVLVSPEDRDMAESIVRAGERAAELTRQLLAYSGKAMFLMEPVDLGALIRATEGLVRASLPKQVRLHLQLGHVPAVTADQNQVRQVILNLAMNAAEAIGPDSAGTVTIETGSQQVGPAELFDVMPDEPCSGHYAWFEIRDTGCGMDSATVAKIFEPFFTTRFLGRGLGLAAVAGIVRSHKGMLRVRSEPGNGSQFRVCFPIAPVEQTPEPDQGAGPFVLVVDDEAVVRQIVRVAMDRAGHKVLVAESGEVAVDVFRRSADSIQIVLLDWKMPLMDGAETLSRLRAIRKDVKVIISSGYSQSEAEEAFRESRVTGYLQKPYRMSELLSLLNRSLPK